MEPRLLQPRTRPGGEPAKAGPVESRYPQEHASGLRIPWGGEPLRNFRRHCHSAFTLIELMTVIAISAVLLTIILIPLFQSFNLTRQALALADAQDKGRELTERISREIGGAVAVREGGRVRTTFRGLADQSISGNATIIRVPRVTVGADGGRFLNPPQPPVEVVLPFTKIDIVKAAQGEDFIDKDNPGQYRDPISGKIDPTLTSPKGQVKLSIAPGQTLVRWFVALHNPLLEYNNPYDGLLQARNGDRDNLYVLYRAEVTPRRWRSVNLTSGTTQMRYVADSRYFEFEGNAVGTDAGTGEPVGLVPKLDDPRFMLNDGVVGKDARIANWLRKAVVQTEISRFDMIQTIYDLASRRVRHDNDGIPQVLPLVQFRPSHVGSDPAEGMVAVRPGDESADGTASAPDVYTTKMSQMSNPTIRTWPVGWTNQNGDADNYLVGRFDPENGLTGRPRGLSIYFYDPALSQDDYIGGVELFDLDLYNDTIARGGLYPFSQAMKAADDRSGWLSNSMYRSAFTPYNLDTARGRIIASFGIDEFGNPNQEPTLANPSNLPIVTTTGVDLNVFTPRTEIQTGAFNTVVGINTRFNVLYNLVEADVTNANGVGNLDLSRIHRAIDLRVTPMADGTPSPLNPGYGFKASIVPGSEIIEGPDQSPGVGYDTTRYVRYNRVNADPGVNQYVINYKDRPEPGLLNGSGVLVPDYTRIGLSGAAIAGFNPTIYSGTNFTSAVIQPQYKTGYLQFNSNPNQPLPPGQIRVYYRVQFTAARSGSNANLPGARQDTFAVDYDSRELMNVLLTIRNYPQSSAPNPQNVTLKATARVRNYLR
ncbi:prepilin-type N-terminal cleavage/methylation domain-containing protein [bacterium]|nr:MAG: prepilin-type N-terminal cleavage/methylation domain-containing protein [bacterium]